MTVITYLDRGDTRNYVTRREALLMGNLPKAVERAGVKLVETEIARLLARDRISTATSAVAETKAAAAAADVAEAQASPEESLRRLDSAEDTPTGAAAKLAKRDLKRAEKAATALAEATRIAYDELLEAVDKDRKVWVAQARVESEKALHEVAALTRRMEQAAARLDAATGVLSMYEGIDDIRDGDEQWKKPLAVLAGGPQSANLKQALVALHQATGRASTYIREALTRGEK